jgi:hypothetical protein
MAWTVDTPNELDRLYDVLGIDAGQGDPSGVADAHGNILPVNACADGGGGGGAATA